MLLDADLVKLIMKSGLGGGVISGTGAGGISGDGGLDVTVSSGAPLPYFSSTSPSVTQPQVLCQYLANTVFWSKTEMFRRLCQANSGSGSGGGAQLNDALRVELLKVGPLHYRTALLC